MFPVIHLHKAGSQFASYLRNARLVVTSAGVETACECLLTGVPAVLIPTKGHFEQYTNSLYFTKNTATIRMAESFESISDVLQTLKAAWSTPTDALRLERDRMITWIHAHETFDW
jgi:UDP-N-acetylglucosamine:LPS N-acetylglucosamine transferase